MKVYGNLKVMSWASNMVLVEKTGPWGRWLVYPIVSRIRRSRYSSTSQFIFRTSLIIYGISTDFGGLNSQAWTCLVFFLVLIIDCVGKNMKKCIWMPFANFGNLARFDGRRGIWTRVLWYIHRYFNQLCWDMVISWNFFHHRWHAKLQLPHTRDLHG